MPFFKKTTKTSRAAGREYNVNKSDCNNGNLPGTEAPPCWRFISRIRGSGYEPASPILSSDYQVACLR